MNIFILDWDLEDNVKFYVDSHVRKMILESGQLLCIANWVCEEIGPVSRKLNKEERTTIDEVTEVSRNRAISERKIPYLPGTHINHPHSVWVRESKSNWMYVKKLMFQINKEYKYRYENGDHKTVKTLKSLDPPENLPDKGFTRPHLGMPDKCKTDSVIESYRNCYRQCKRHLASWKKREKPYWF